MRKIKINGVVRDIHCNLKAIEEIEKNGCKISEINDWLIPAKGEVVGDFEKIAILLVAMINGAIYQHNTDIDYGIKDGDKTSFLTNDEIKKHEYFVKTMKIVDFVKIRNVISYEISESFGFELPEGMEEEIDLDLADCPSEKNALGGTG